MSFLLPLPPPAFLIGSDPVVLSTPGLPMRPSCVISSYFISSIAFLYHCWLTGTFILSSPPQPLSDSLCLSIYLSLSPSVPVGKDRIINVLHYISSHANQPGDEPTGRRTDGRTDGQTDGQTDIQTAGIKINDVPSSRGRN